MADNMTPQDRADRAAISALAALEQAWAYFTPAPHVHRDVVEYEDIPLAA